jgi:hypothetical protein
VVLCAWFRNWTGFLGGAIITYTFYLGARLEFQDDTGLGVLESKTQQMAVGVMRGEAWFWLTIMM